MSSPDDATRGNAIVRLLWALSAHVRYYLRRYMPTNKAQSVMKLRAAVRKTGVESNVAKTISNELSESAGFDVASTLDKVTEAMVGTRESLFRDKDKDKDKDKDTDTDTGTRRWQLCVVFDDPDRVTSVLAWAIMRPLSFLLSDGREKRTAPALQRKPPPRLEDMSVDRTAMGSACRRSADRVRSQRALNTRGSLRRFGRKAVSSGA